MMENKLTIDTIASLSGVAKSTVSRYLNGGSVRASTAQKIQKVIEENHYEPNVFARLSAKKSHIIGVVVPGFNSVTTPRLIEVIVKHLKANHYTPLILHTGNDLQEEKSCILRLTKMNVDGIMVLSTGITEQHRKIVKQIHIPLLFLGQNLSQVKAVKMDDYHAGYDMGQYVAQQGCKHVVCLWVDEQDPAVGKERKNGMMDGLRDGGATDIALQYTTFFYDDVISHLHNMLDVQQLPDAIVCATDRIAEGVYKVCMEKGIAIGQELSVTGFGDYETSELLTPALTTVRFDWQQWGELSVETMLHMIQGDDVPSLQLVPYQLMIRQSVVHP